MGDTHSDDGEAARTCTICSTAQTRTIYGGTEDLTWNDNNWGWRVEGINSPVDIICIPDFHEGEPVTTIRDYAFRDTALITVIILAEDPSALGPNVFLDCNALDAILVPPAASPHTRPPPAGTLTQKSLTKYNRINCGTSQRSNGCHVAAACPTQALAFE